MPIDATNCRRRSSDELNRLPYAKMAAHRAVCTTIGQELKARYEVPRDLPHLWGTLVWEDGKHRVSGDARASLRPERNLHLRRSVIQGRPLHYQLPYLSKHWSRWKRVHTVRPSLRTSELFAHET